MKKQILLLISCFLIISLFAQNKEEAEKLVNQGIEFHDKGDYDQAILIYNQALELDKDNALALAEKAFSLLAYGKADESIVCCRRAIEKRPGAPELDMVYVTYGNALDESGQAARALEIYDEGISKYPEYYQLYFNKGIALTGMDLYDDAILCFQKSLTIRPDHAGSNNALARILKMKNKRIPALLVYCRFLVLEPDGTRAAENLASLQEIMKGNVEVKGKKKISVNITPDMLSDTTEDGQVIENSFSTTDMMLALDASLDYDKKNAKKTEVELFLRKFQTVCTFLELSRDDNYGFYWDYYVPYITELYDKNFAETFSYIAFASTGEAYVNDWLTAHEEELVKFYQWSAGFEWHGVGP
jgi:tetratricopeptide (TPR) repeat protein